MKDPAKPKDGHVARDIAYGPDPRQRFDLYLPANARAPLVLFVHGPDWRSGDKDAVAGLEALLDAGLGVASVNYRFAPDHRWPAQIEDVSAALNAIIEQSAGLIADRFGVFGIGAGGHLAAHLALMRPDLVRAAAILSAPVEFDAMDTDMTRSGVDPVQGRADASGSAMCDLVGAVIAHDPSAAALASPLTTLARLPAQTRLPNFLILHGACDAHVARGQSARLAYALAQHQGLSQLELDIVPEASLGAKSLARATEFLARALGAGANF